jgi:hypothetical protein
MPTPAPTPTPTPSCPNGVVPPWPVPAGDTDCDGFTDAQELFVGTDPSRACGPDAWPPDINNDQLANGSDLLTFALVFGSISANSPYNARFDLNNDGRINGSDLLKFAPFFGKHCA